MSVLSHQSCPSLCDPLDCSPQVSSVHRISKTRIQKWVAISLPGDFPYLRIEPVSLASAALQADFLLTEPLGRLCITILESRNARELDTY